MYIGLTGYMGSGKGEIARLLKDRGYRYMSLSDAVRQEATIQNLEHSRENLQMVGNNLRSQYGGGILGRKICQEMEQTSYDQWVIDGIRNPAETIELRRLPNFHLLGVSASTDIIIERILNRNRSGDSLSASDIKTKLDKERGINEPEDGQQVAKCLQATDFLIVNEGSLEELKSKLHHFIGLIKGTDRPTFDETFMEIAYTWAQRTTCLRRKVGAVIAKDKQQLTAGYNGAPRGLKHCAELGGCLREKLNIPSGQRHEICRGTHAEQNAITQAAKFGINIINSTLYCNTFPCVICAKMIINAGISKIVYDSDYDDDLSKEMLNNQNKVKIVRYEGRMFH